MGAVNEQFALRGQAGQNTVPVTFSWSATDASGIKAYGVYVSTDGGSWVQDSSLSADATSVTYNLTVGSSYQVAVQAEDNAGNWSAHAYSTRVTAGFLDDTSFSIDGWTQYPLSGSVGGTYTASAQPGAWVQDTFTGTDIALVAPLFSTAGVATIYCDGSSIGDLDLSSGSTQTGKVEAECHFSQSGQHTMKVVVSGTSGGPWVGIDGFATLG
jgi:hypothetical protein